MEKGSRITEMYAFVCLDEKENVEGIPAIEGPFADGKNVLMPLVAADKERMMAILDLAQKMVNKSGKSMRLVRFHQSETLDILTPALIKVPPIEEEPPEVELPPPT